MIHAINDAREVREPIISGDSRTAVTHELDRVLQFIVLNSIGRAEKLLERSSFRHDGSLAWTRLT